MSRGRVIHASPAAFAICVAKVPNCRRAAHQDRLSRFDIGVLEQHLPRGNGDDWNARRRHVVERNRLACDVTGLDQRILAIELVVRCAIHGVAEREHADVGAEHSHHGADFEAEGQRQRLAEAALAFADEAVPRPDDRTLHSDQHLARSGLRTGKLVEPHGVKCRRIRELE